MTRLDGKGLAIELEAVLKTKIASKAPCLAIVQVADDPASSTYVKNKMAACARVGVEARRIALPAETSQTELADLLKKLNTDPDVNGVLLQLPLPQHLKAAHLIRLISPLKDVDVFRPETLRLRAANGDALTPCVVGAIESLRQKYAIPFADKRIVVVGKGRTGGGPVFK